MESSFGAVVDDIAGAALVISAILGAFGFVVSLTTAGGPVSLLVLVFAAVQGLLGLGLFANLPFVRPIGTVVILFVAIAAFLSGAMMVAVPCGAVAGLLLVGMAAP